MNLHKTLKARQEALQQESQLISQLLALHRERKTPKRRRVVAVANKATAKTRKWTKAQREAAAKRMRAYWRSKRKG